VYYRDRDRLLLSSFLAVMLYGILFLVLRNTSWSAEQLYPDRMGPVMVSIEPFSERPEPRQPIEEPPPPEPEPIPQPSEPEEVEQPAPRAERAGRETSPPVSRPKPITPSGEGGVEAPFVPPDSIGEGTAPPEDVFDFGDLEEEKPDDIRGESKIIYAEDALTPEEEQPGEIRTEDEEVSDESFEFDDEDLDLALASSEPETGDESGIDRGGSADGDGDVGQPDYIDIEFETPGADRKLLYWEDPVLSRDQISGLPPRTEVVVVFFVSANGYLSDPSVLRSSGSTGVDAEVIKAMRGWRFEEADIRVEATVRYVIQQR